jgi:hypothetical protein
MVAAAAIGTATLVTILAVIFAPLLAVLGARHFSEASSSGGSQPECP